MKKTYTQILDQIESLKKQAEAARSKEVDGVIERMKEAIAFYGLTREDLGFSTRGRPPSTTGGRPKKAGRKNGAKAPSQPKFRDDQGNAWSGRGPRPRWLKAALDAGRKLEDFAA